MSHSLELTSAVPSVGPSRRDVLEQTSKAAEDLWLVLPELLQLGMFLDPVWGHLSAPWHTLKPREQGAEHGIWQGWSWDGVGVGSQALQPDTSTGRRENTVQSSHMERDPTYALGRLLA